ncbi:unnamed protein product [Candida verbasci]|uniref:S1 motif domain-containing protein n=1 Tax=Candida verbasci TaxID=1227364 RepID=A0A9W4TSV6_9ASCO|nr:unnamed protein product [Candida verbasci]
MSDSKSVLSNKETSFPRGGKTALTPLEVKEISNEVQKDVLFESSSLNNKRSIKSKSDQPKKKQKKSNKKNKDIEDDEEEVSIPIEYLTFKNLITGSLVLGQIQSINKLDIALALGDNLVGYIPITSINSYITNLIEKFEEESESESESESEDEDEQDDALIKAKEFPNLSNIFKIGSWLKARVSIPEDSNKKRIELNIEPEIVNENLENEDLLPGNVLQCFVKSIEDHGVILDTGKSVSGFISNKDLDIEVKEGTVILCSVLSQPKGRTINLKPVTQPNKKYLSSITSIDSIQPGIIVDALVTDVTSTGLVTKVFGLVDGTINLSSIHEFDLSKLKLKFAIGSNIKARVIAVLFKNGTKKLVLSIIPQILQLENNTKETESLEAFPRGHTFDEVEVIGVDSNYIFVKFGSSELFGQIHNSKINENKTLTDYSVGSKHKSRVIGYNIIDLLLILSFESKVINAKYLDVKDIPIGTLIKDVAISKVLPEQGGINVSFDDFNGFVPPNQMSDIKLVYPERKFRVGSKVKGRLLKFKGSKPLITLRKALVNLEDDEILSNFDQVSIGFKSNAIVEKFVHNGCIVSFFGDLRAFLPKNEISETFVDDASNYLKLGQIVKTRILDINKDTQRLIVSLKQSTTITSSEINQLIPGKSVVEAMVVEKKNNSVIISIDGVNGVIHDGQLSDKNFEQNRAAFKKLSISSKLKVLIIEKDIKNQTVICSAKQSLIDDAERGLLPTQFEEIELNKSIRGFVKSITNLGLFVSFSNKLTGLILAKYINTKEDLNKKFFKNQSVTCRVINIDLENKRFLLSLDSKEKEDEEVINPIDSSKKLISDFTPGVETLAKIKSIKGTQLNVQLGDNLHGRVDITQVFKSFDDIKSISQPLNRFHKGEQLKVKVIGYHDAKNHTYLPITHRRSNRNTVLELSINDPKNVSQLKLSDIKKGQEFISFINNITKGFVWVSISPSIKGHIQFLDLSNNGQIFEDLDNKLPIGSALKVKVKSVDQQHQTLSLTARTEQVESIKDLKNGENYPAKVIKVKENYVLVDLGNSLIASSFITDALNDYTKKLDSVFVNGDFVSATILDIDAENKKIAVSLRTAEGAKDKVIDSYKDLSRGDIVNGFIKNIGNNGIYVSLGRSVFALVRISDLSDSYLKDWKKYYKVGQPIQGKIVNCKEENRVLMTLKESEINGELKTLKQFDDLSVGDIFEGVVNKTTEYGVFVKLNGTLNISGLCHHSEISENDVTNVSSIFGEGDKVKVKILKKDDEKKQLSLGMKASYFTENGTTEQQEEVEDEQDEMEVDNEEEEEEEEENSSDSDVDMNGEENESEDDASDNEEEEEGNKSIGLSTNGFDWTASILDQADDDESSSDEDEEQLPDSNNKRKKKNQKKFIEDKTADLNTRAPQSTQDFERLLIGNPNSSILWMNYMSFQLQLSEIDNAREIGERALKTINYREELEKLNIWIAMLNLENTFGTEESLDEVFKKSCQYMDSFTMHQKLINIFIMSEKFDKAEELLKVMTKKFNKNINTWILYGSFLLDQNDNDKVHEILSRGLKVLPKSEHIELVKKFAQLEFQKGDQEQGRSLFEGLISDVPKRIDLWNVYIDQEIKYDNEENDNKSKIENLFERVILNKKLTRKQAKFLFNKWLKFEEDKNDENMMNKVKTKAIEYVESHKD